jgi:Tfp pilus assembly protein PilN
MRAVNLLPRDQARPRLEGRRTPLLAAAGGMLVVALASFALAHSASKTEGDRRAEADSVRALIARLPAARTPTVSTSSIAQERSQRLAAFTIALRSRIALDKVLQQVGLVLPRDAWLTGFKAATPVTTEPQTPGASGPTSSPGSATSSADEGVTIEGATYSQEGVARVLARLGLVPMLENVQLTSSAVVAPASSETGKPNKNRRAVVAFTITASVRGGAAS